VQFSSGRPFERRRRQNHRHPPLGIAPFTSGAEVPSKVRGHLMIDFQCPHCGARIRVPEAAAGSKGKCKKCGNKIRVPASDTVAPEPPDHFYQLVEEPLVAETPPPIRKRAQPAAGADVREIAPVITIGNQWIAIACGAAGLALLAASAWLPWIKVFAGSISAIGTPSGKIVFGVSLATGLAVATAYTLRKLCLYSALAASAWGTISTLWLGSLLYKVATIVQDSVQDKSLQDNPFAKMLATQVGPGFGLYLAPAAGLLVTGGFSYIVLQQAAKTKSLFSLSSFIGAQIVAVVVGFVALGRGGFYAGEPTVSGRENNATAGVAFPGMSAGPIPALFPQRTSEAKRSEVKELERKQTDASRAAAKLKQFQILRARFYTEKDSYRNKPIIELVVKNGTNRAVRRAYFRGTLQTPGRAIPWLREEFNYPISGGLEPGEQAEWTLSPNMFSAWGNVEEKPNMVFNVEVLRLDGPDGEAFLKADWDDSDQKKLDLLKKELSEGE
jgi:predicted Zn finger-like uncharacterized protein